MGAALLQRAWRGLIAALALAVLAGCAALPQAVGREPSQAITEVATAPLARIAEASTPESARHLSGVRLLPDAREALALRLALVRNAQVSVDAMYYLVAADGSGSRFLAELEAAARRGVRVRLLVDDLHAADADAALRRLAELPAAEVRLFNPLPSRAAGWSARLLLSLHEFERINRRMHNKLLLADHAFAVSGGRNIGDEYFLRSTASNFIDMDTLTSGAIVGELAALFDAFWNSPQAYPIGALGIAAAPADPAAADAAPAAALAAAEDDADAGDSADAAAVPGVLGELVAGRVGLHFAPVALHADAPQKAAGASAITAMDRTLQLFRSAQREIDVVSPYFVPGSYGMALMRDAVERGIKLKVTTNSLASTDEPLAYWGYARYRGEMLALGVELTELSPTGAFGASRAGVGHGSTSVGRLHAKVATVDRRWLLIGSLNMDARSARSNTELTLVIDSPALADEMASLLHAHWAEDHWRLRAAGGSRRAPAAGDHGGGDAGSDDGIEWVSPDASRVHRSEPMVGWWSRLRLSLLSMLVPEDWL